LLIITVTLPRASNNVPAIRTQINSIIFVNYNGGWTTSVRAGGERSAAGPRNNLFVRDAIGARIFYGL
jgi:hypothetical protein